MSVCVSVHVILRSGGASNIFPYLIEQYSVNDQKVVVFSEMGKESKKDPEKRRGSYRTYRRNLAQKRNNQELKELRELLKWGPQQAATPQPNALISGYPDPQQVLPSTAALVERATRDLEERNRQLKSHISQLQAEAKEREDQLRQLKGIIAQLQADKGKGNK